MLDVSIIICTFNRAESLKVALLSLRSARRPADFSWEIVVVDNNSVDHTQSIVKEMSDSLPIICIKEPRQGSSHARNAGAGVARGDLLLFIDDDVSVSENWLETYFSTAKRYPEILHFGGPIRPQMEQEMPVWLKRNSEVSFIRDRLGALNHGPNEEVIGRGMEYFAANMGFRKSVFKDHSFDGQLGLSGKIRRSGEETQLLNELVDLGHRWVWCPQAWIFHRVGLEQLTVGEILSYARAQGIARVKLNRVRIFFGSRKLSAIPYFIFGAVLWVIGRSYRLLGFYPWPKYLGKAHLYLGCAYALIGT